MNNFGKIFTSPLLVNPGAAIGGVVDGCPAGVKIDIDLIQADLNRRKPGQSHITTSRQESDQVELLSGILRVTQPRAPSASW